jgi:hypothetical protein
MHMRPSTVSVRVLVALAISAGIAGADGNWTATYHRQYALSVYRSATVEIGLDGHTRCTRGIRANESETAEIDLSSQEVVYYRHLFDHVVALDRAGIELTAVDAGVTTWRVTSDSETRELTYICTENPWALAAERAIQRLVSRAFFLCGSDVAVYPPGTPSDDLLRDAALIAPEALRGRFRAELAAKVMARRSPGRHRTAAGILKRLAYCEPPEMWVGDVMLAYEQAGPDLRMALLMAIAEFPFDVGEDTPRGYLLTPLMIQGLEWVLTSAPGEMKGNSTRWRVACELIGALGKYRDARAIPVLTSPTLWTIGDSTHALRPSAARALCRMGMPGVILLVGKTSFDPLCMRDGACRELRRAVATYGSRDHVEPRSRVPDPGKVEHLRRFLVERGIGLEGMDAFSVPAGAAKALHASFPGWEYVPTSEFDVTTLEGWGKYDFAHSGPQRCRLDFDGNGVEDDEEWCKDIALIVRKDDRLKVIVLLQHPAEASNATEGSCSSSLPWDTAQWTTCELTEFAVDRVRRELWPGHVPLIVSIAPVSAAQMVAVNASSSRPVIPSKGDGIELREETGRTVFYWSE